MIGASGDGAHHCGTYAISSPKLHLISGSRACSQHPSEEGTLACHRQGGADPGGLQPVEHPLQEAVGGPAALGEEDLRGPAGEVFPTRKGCPSGTDPIMRRILAVAYPDLDGRLKAAQQTEGGEYRNHCMPP
ncbi:hypothetical protein NDU88_008662 [Pleurodeles waltl]|uniref:Uncharacterized protein n=1 Tax=Pleurodeles waltl TaxID=8319 RepID=A0AAV7PTR0_PLEWA|nr:hypothetical protein NDU88_008662 [Pleurodeles waltl]